MCVASCSFLETSRLVRELPVTLPTKPSLGEVHQNRALLHLHLDRHELGHERGSPFLSSLGLPRDVTVGKAKAANAP